MEGVKTSPVNIEKRQEIGVRAGDTVRVSQKIQEKGKTRIQVFEGLVLSRKHGNEPGATFTVRKVSNGVGVEKTFPLYSPMIDKIEIVRRSKVRRAKLYFIREKVAREIRKQMRNMRMVAISTGSDAEEKEAAAKAAEAEPVDNSEADSAQAESKEESQTKTETKETKEEKPTEDADSATADEVDASASETPNEDKTETSAEEPKEEEK